MLEDILAHLQQKQKLAGESGVVAAFELNWQGLEPEAQKLACLLSLFALAPIPWSFIESAASASNLEFDIKATCNNLIQRYILQHLREDIYQIHERIRELLQVQVEKILEVDELKHGFCQAMVTVAKKISNTSTTIPQIQIEITKANLAIPHLAECATIYQNWLTNEEYLELLASLKNLAVLCQIQGRYAEAEFLFQQELELYKRLLGNENSYVATSLNNLAGLYDSQGRYSEAEPLYKKALELRQRLLGEEHPDVATSFNNLALLYYSQGRYSEAEPLYKKALELRQRLLGEGHPDVATSFNNLAFLHYSQGRYSEAEPLYKKALELRQRLLGEEHPDVATSFNNLAGLYDSQGRYSEAEPLYKKALELRQRLLGEEHPDVASSFNNLAFLHYSQGRYSEAEPLYKKALELRQRLLEEEHPDVTSSFNNLAGLYQSQGRYSKAEPLYQQALAIADRSKIPTKLTPNSSFSFTLRLQIPNRVGMLASVTQAIATCGGNLGEIDLIEQTRQVSTRDLTVDAASTEHAETIVQAVKALAEIKVLSAYDRTFNLHRRGKISITSRIPLKSISDLAMAYTPGVGRICTAIAQDSEEVYNLTIKQNTVAIVTDGSALLGLGNLGPAAALSVMEGKAMLFKEFAGLDAFPICLATQDTDEIVQTVKNIAPVFGGVNLEDIAAPRCFEIEQRLRQELDIPVFHDDQHGTAIVTLAALFNVLKLVHKPWLSYWYIITDLRA